MVHGGSEAVIQPQLNLCARHLHHLMFISAARLMADSADLAQSQRSLSLAVNGLCQHSLSTRVLPTPTAPGPIKRLCSVSDYSIFIYYLFVYHY